MPLRKTARQEFFLDMASLNVPEQRQIFMRVIKYFCSLSELKTNNQDEK